MRGRRGVHVLAGRPEPRAHAGHPAVRARVGVRRPELWTTETTAELNAAFVRTLSGPDRDRYDAALADCAPADVEEPAQSWRADPAFADLDVEISSWVLATVDDPRVHVADASWSACMAEAGYDVGSPDEAEEQAAAATRGGTFSDRRGAAGGDRAGGRRPHLPRVDGVHGVHPRRVARRPAGVRRRAPATSWRRWSRRTVSEPRGGTDPAGCRRRVPRWSHGREPNAGAALPRARPAARPGDEEGPSSRRRRDPRPRRAGHRPRRCALGARAARRPRDRAPLAARARAGVDRPRRAPRLPPRRPAGRREGAAPLLRGRRRQARHQRLGSPGGRRHPRPRRARDGVPDDAGGRRRAHGQGRRSPPG